MLIENFLWDLQWYLNTNISSEEEVFLGSLVHAVHAKTW
ncbi:unnamed protein product [Spirodela intermedia]|uniref:Uncharacterized protein n=1 Tax=Spirodela intermedia TaxID=51605 RepID=A0A7I8KGB9_SPIIN|nr:unnamed protein product [Spirodela intermedia]